MKEYSAKILHLGKVQRIKRVTLGCGGSLSQKLRGREADNFSVCSFVIFKTCVFKSNSVFTLQLSKRKWKSVKWHCESCFSLGNVDSQRS